MNGGADVCIDSFEVKRMSKQRLRTGIATFIGIMILILDSKTALSGAKEGLDLCIRTVIPSLFPFFVLSSLLTGSLMGMKLRILRPIGRLFGLQQGAESLLIPGFLGGYPAGAHSITAAYKAGQLSKENAQKLLAYCNNAGPAFLFGMIGPMFPKIRYCWYLWGIHILSAFLVSRFFPVNSISDTSNPPTAPGITETMTASVKTMAMVCGWVTVFRVLIAFLNRWMLWLLPVTVRVAVAGLLELSNGCCSLVSIGNIPVRFVLCACLLAFGGLCVTMQTASAAQGLSLRYYIIGKTLQGLFSFLLCLCILHPWLIFPLIPAYFLVISGKNRKNSRNPAALGV